MGVELCVEEFHEEADKFLQINPLLSSEGRSMNYFVDMGRNLCPGVALGLEPVCH